MLEGLQCTSSEQAASTTIALYMPTIDLDRSLRYGRSSRILEDRNSPIGRREFKSNAGSLSHRIWYAVVAFQ